MIICPKCDAENLMGALFCRTCGARLNLNEMRPKTAKASGFRGVARVVVIVWRLAIVAALLGVVGVLVAMFLEPARRAIPALDDTEKSNTAKLYAALFLPLRTPKDFTFTSAQLTELANDKLGLTGTAADAGMALAPEHIEIDCLASGYLRVVLRSRLMGKVAVFSTLIVAIEADETEGVKCRVARVRAGRLSLPDSARAFIADRVVPLFEDNRELAYIRNNIAQLEVGDGQLTFKFKATGRDKKALTALRDLIPTLSAP